MRYRWVATLGVAAVLWSGPAAAQAPALGAIEFPTSGSAEAQPFFLDGVKNLHSFEFDQAATDFRKAQEADPDFALAYWGEAMSYNHPLWAEVDMKAARDTLARLGATREERLAKAGTEKEKDYLRAIELLFGPGDKLERDLAYSEAMARMHERYADDDEVTTFYALSLLGTVRSGDPGYRRQILAASMMLDVFERNPQHPGAAHFIIHSFDDPEHAPLALDAAFAYSKIAPDAPHALHMPSHIFLQRGMWKEAAEMNRRAYTASVARGERRGDSPTRRDFHSLSWLQYIQLQSGDYRGALESIDIARPVAEETGAPRVTSAVSSMQARYLVETGQWNAITLEAFAPARAETSTDRVMRTYDASADVLLAMGLKAAGTGDLQTAEQIRAKLAELVQADEQAGRYSAKSKAIMEREVAALIALGRDQHDAAVAALEEATAIELALDPPSGPPDPIKPSHELFGEVLLKLDRPADAARQFTVALERMPKRAASLLGAARAAVKLGDTATARRHYADLLEGWSAEGADLPQAQEARAFLGPTSDQD